MKHVELFAASAAISLRYLAAWQFRPSLSSDAHATRTREDVVLVPPPAQTKALALGHDAAMVDYLWGQLLVQHGIHVNEKRRMPLERYIDPILYLEPDFPPMFAYVDTLFVFRPPRGTEEDARTARTYLEKGLQVRPYDHKVWMHYGQFLAFLAPSFLTMEAERDEWTRDGAHAIAHAVELGGDSDRALSASTLLARYGDQAAAITSLERVLAIESDENIKLQLQAKLDRLRASRAASEKDLRAKAASAFIDGERRKEAPFVGNERNLTFGPWPNAYRCVGLDARAEPRCATTWREALERRGD